MTAEPSPGQEVRREEFAGAFTPRRPVVPQPSQPQPQPQPPDTGFAWNPPRQPVRQGRAWTADQERPPQRSGRRYDDWDEVGDEAGDEVGEEAGGHGRYGNVPQDEPGWRPAAPGAQPVDPPSSSGFASEADPEDSLAKLDEPSASGGRGKWLALALALLLLGLGGTAVALREEGGPPVASRQLTSAWQVPDPAAGDELIGSWLTGSLLVRAATEGGVTAYRLADGGEAWNAAPVRGGGDVPCAMSPTLTAQGLGTIAFGADANSCSTLAGVDTATGKILWTIPLVDADHPASLPAQTFVQGDVATIVSENFLGGVDVRTGRRVWGFRPRADYCNVYDWGVTGVVLVDQYCADSNAKFTLSAYDGGTGRLLWTENQTFHTDALGIFTGTPLIAAVHTPQDDSVRVFDASGRSRKLEVGNTEVHTGSGPADHSARLVGNVLVAPAEDAKGPLTVAFDIRTGALLWSRRGGMLATAAPGDRNIYVDSTSGARQLLQLDPETGRVAAVTGLPSAADRWSPTGGTVYVTSDGGVLELGAQGGARYYG